jgi:hypothetical protein
VQDVTPLEHRLGRHGSLRVLMNPRALPRKAFTPMLAGFSGQYTMRVTHCPANAQRGLFKILEVHQSYAGISDRMAASSLSGGWQALRASRFCS